MFSVDNFYSFMQSKYGWGSNKIILYKHLTAGSKNIEDLQPYFEGAITTPWSAFYRKIILHDQEPFSKGYLDTYRNYRLEINNRHPAWIQAQPEDMLMFHFRTCSWPVFCHSEKNSDDIKWLDSVGFTTCHYLWHGLISRDWLRHWKHHPDLQHRNDSWTKRFLIYARGKTGTRIYRTHLLEALDDIKQNLLYDWEGKIQVPSSYSATIDVNDAQDSAVHLVAETVFDQNKIHATEKVFKPMVMRQPFIVFAGAGMLQYLRDYGFQTFDSVWDESYDLESDHSKRFNLIINLIHHLNSLPNKEFRSTLSQCQHILDHNRRHFFSEQFESIMLDELDRNMTTAIETQKRRRQVDPGGSFFFLLNKFRARQIPFTPGINEVLDYFNAVDDPNKVAYLEKVSRQYPWFDQSLPTSYPAHRTLGVS
jgi:hypothetical protein